MSSQILVLSGGCRPIHFPIYSGFSEQRALVVWGSCCGKMILFVSLCLCLSLSVCLSLSLSHTLSLSLSLSLSYLDLSPEELPVSGAIFSAFSLSAAVPATQRKTQENIYNQKKKKKTADHSELALWRGETWLSKRQHQLSLAGRR